MKSSRDSSKSKSSKSAGGEKLSPFFRFILYGLLGITLDVYYFAILDTLLKGELDLVGRTNVIILPAYGFGFLLIEFVSTYLKPRNVSIYIRGLIYTLIGYILEFATGHFLLKIGQDYWDYSDFSYNVQGIIIPHTGPLWFLVGIVGESLVIDRVRRMKVMTK